MEAVSLFLAFVLAMSAVHKVMAPERLGESAARLAGVPLVDGQMLSFTAAAIEMAAAVALVFVDSRFVGGLLAAGLWSAYAALLWRMRGRVLDCGCSFGRQEGAVGLFAISRAAGLAAIAMIPILLPGGSVNVISVFAGLAFLALYLALDALLAIPHPHWRHAS